MKQLIAICLTLLAVTWSTGVAEAQDDDRGILQAFLEDNLSTAGRTVRIEGFSGALSGRATVDTLSIADADGVWLSLNDVVFDWNRSALLRGALDVTELSAGSISVVRPPRTEDSAPAPEATPFALPELPVSIAIDQLDIASLTLGPAFLGEEVVLRVTGAAGLADSAGNATLEVERIDDATGMVRLAGSYSNATEVLALDLEVSEGPAGIVAGLLDLPGEPSIGLTVAGEDPLSAFSADITLATDGTPRLTGAVSVAQETENGAAEDAPTNTVFTADIGGDLRPLVTEDYHAFLGQDQRLNVAGTQFADGRLQLDDLTLRTDALSLTGRAALRADGWPQALALNGTITPDASGEILLAIPGDRTWIGGAEIALTYDADAGDDWTLDMAVDALRRSDLQLARAEITGGGQLSRGLESVRGTVDLGLSGVALTDPDLAMAIGETLSGQLGFDWQPGAPLTLRDMRIAGGDYDLSGDAQIEGVDGAVDLAISLDTRLRAGNLAQFAPLTGQAIDGAATLEIAGDIAPVAGAFDLIARGTGRDISTGIAQADALIAGAVWFTADAVRDGTGLTLRAFSLDAPRARVTAQGTLATDASDLGFDARLTDLADVVPGASGPATLTGTATQAGTIWTLSTDLTAPGTTTGRVEAAVNLVEGAPGPVTGSVTLRSADLSPYAQVSGTNLRGTVALSAEGSGDLGDQSFDITLSATGDNLAIGQQDADRLLRGRSQIDAQVSGDADGRLTITRFDLQNPEVTADLTGTLSTSQVALRYDAALRDVGLFAPGLNGRLASQGRVSGTTGPLQINSDVQGPGGATATIAGQIARDAATMNLGITGALPLALANRFTAPNLVTGTAALDLRIDGAPGVGALSGTVRSTGARVTIPAARVSLDDIDTTITLRGGAANVALRSALSSGGQITVSGRAGLSAPFSADLLAELGGLTVTDPGLYETSIDGRVTLNGPLTGGARIGGALTLGQTEIRIPSGAGAAGGSVTGLVHLNEPASVRRTRARAGLVEQDTSSGGGAAFPLDLTISAPARIFVRGRGLDAEFGGALRLRGTTANVVPSGRFDLIRGRLDILGKRLTLTEALLQMQGQLDPFIRTVATTTSGDTTINITIEGPVSEPQVRFGSTPDLPEDEILARLLFGRDVTQISALQALQLANAVRVLAGQGGEGVVGQLRQNFGLDDLDIQTDEDGEVGLRAGRYISDNAYTDVTVDSSGKSEINLNIDISPSVTLRGSAGTDGSTGLGIYFERDY
ncbi:translocation/assembly module TamB domain-containing protein [Tateyamaria sp. SN6-1]|uniref:translocation/assembly module TamB domain-containing protein n=1 Tax=Tateyamaria sp. SN6-1 TaxID=3092148 RepID=UPI0039F4487B